MELSSVFAMEATQGNKLLPIMVGNHSEISGFIQELPLLSHRLYQHWDPSKSLEDNVAEAKAELIRAWKPAAEVK